MSEFRMLPEGDTAVCVEFGNEIKEEINQQVAGLCQSLLQKSIKGVVEVVPTFRSLMVYYDNALISGNKLEKKLRKRITADVESIKKEKRIIEIPVCYESIYAPDMKNVEEHTGLSAEEIIKRHTGRTYLIYMLGFLPGFPYLGGMDESLVTPRLASPRVKIEPGAVGIGGEQTGIYPLASPGGWQLIGKTPVILYDPNRNPPILYEAGDYIRFVRISETEFKEIEKDAASYTCNVIKEGI